MTLKVGLIGDVHATPEPLREALQIFHGEGVETILCAGDIAGYGNKLEQTIDLLIKHDCRAVVGNHDLWHFERRDADTEGPVADYLRSLPATLSLDLSGTRLLMVHASPPASVMDGIRLLDEEGTLLADQQRFWADVLAAVPAEVLVVGHTHQVFAEQLGHLLVINPGSTLFNHTCAVLSLPDKSVTVYPLSGKEPILSWNFSMFKDAMLGE